MCLICSFQNADSRQLVDEHKLTHGEFLLHSVNMMLSDPPYNLRSCCDDTNSQYDVLNLEGVGGCGSSSQVSDEIGGTWSSVVFCVTVQSVALNAFTGKGEGR